MSTCRGGCCLPTLSASVISSRVNGISERIRRQSQFFSVARLCVNRMVAMTIVILGVCACLSKRDKISELNVCTFHISGHGLETVSFVQLIFIIIATSHLSP